MVDNSDLPDVDELLHPEERARFRALCLETSSAEFAELAGVVRLHRDRVLDLADHRTDTDTARRIAASLERLLTDGSGFAPDERRLIRGAVEYFLLNEDADGDLEEILGFDDDARIVNSVLEHIGRPDLRVEFE